MRLTPSSLFAALIFLTMMSCSSPESEDVKFEKFANAYLEKFSEVKSKK